MNYTIVTDRGGHLHNARMLLEQIGSPPTALVTTLGPDVDSLRRDPDFAQTRVHCLPRLETWVGKQRFWNPFRFFWQLWVALFQVVRFRPKAVISVGAANVILYCYWARLFGAKIYHVECMNQVFSRSITGVLLYPICHKMFVQWKELLNRYGPKAQYAGWVL